MNYNSFKIKATICNCHKKIKIIKKNTARISVNKDKKQENYNYKH